MTMLETCLGISGAFEGGNGQPRWDLVTGSFDGAGISCGALQWNAGQGTLQILLKNTIGAWPIADDELKPLWLLKDMTPAEAIPYAIQQWGDSAGKGVTPQARALWSTLLNFPQCIQAQQDLAQAILDKALREAARFLPWRSDTQEHLRIAAFFFDVRVQQGGLSKKLHDGTYQPDPLTAASQANPTPAIDYATAQGKIKTAVAWKAVVDAGDALAPVLLDYAFKRAALGNPTYMWDTLSRRGTIATRLGAVHGAWHDFTQTLP